MARFRETLISCLIKTWLFVLLAAIGAIYAIIYSRRPFMHDDLNYFIHNSYWLATHHPVWLRWPTHIIGCWLNVNGRLGDSTNFIWFNLFPRWLMGITEGLMIVAMYCGVIAWLKKFGFGITGYVTATAVCMFALPWWDGYGLMVVQVNYVWGSALALWALYFTVCRPPKSLMMSLVLALFALIASAWHEAIGVPLAISIIIALMAKPSFRKSRTLVPSIAFIVGGAYTILSPAIWNRISAESIPDDAPALLILKTVPLVMLLGLAVIALLLRNPTRLWHLFISDNCRCGILTATALTSAAIAVSSGIVGRSGWFAEITALLALADLAARNTKDLPKMGYIAGTVLSISLLALMSLQTILTYTYQTRYDAESKALIEAYLQSADGTVIAPVPDASEAPALLLKRAHLFPPLYDSWVRRCLQNYRSFLQTPTHALPNGTTGSPVPVIIPPGLDSLTHIHAISPAEGLPFKGGILMSDADSEVDVPNGYFPYPVFYRGLRAVVFIPVPPGDRPSSAE